MTHPQSITPTAVAGPVLLVDDAQDIQLLVSRWLEQAGYDVDVASDAEQCLQRIEASLPGVVLLDLALPGMDGLAALRRIRQTHRFLPVVMLTGDESVETVVAAMQAGAHDYLSKPVDRTRLTTAVANAQAHHHMALKIALLEREASGHGHDGLLGESQKMREMCRQIDRVSLTDISVYVHGETGTGKELVARSIHAASGRAGGPFVAVNCAAIPEHLQESELFGHERGAFTGAHRLHRGRFEQANGGTLFLDEIGELSLALQAKLLRVLQERRFFRVGGNAEITSDFRVIAATHRDLAELTRAGAFREDLYFRVAVFELEVPPLRARQGDVALLSQHMLMRITGPDGKSPTLSPEALAFLEGYSFPGNVRELENLLQRAAVVCMDGTVHAEDFPPRARLQGGQASSEPMRGDGPAAQTGAVAEPSDHSEHPATIQETERRMIEKAIKRTGGNLSEVGRQLGIGRTTLYRKLKKHGLRT